MRTILVMALTANIFFSVGANYLQGAIVSQAAAPSKNTVSMLASTANPPAEQTPKF
jgi:hypothetical protein